MSTDNLHIFDEYIVQGETTQKQRAENWQIAIGLQDVDKLKNSRYLLNTAKEHIEGKIDLAAAEERIADYYRTEEGRKLAADRTDEADIVATRIAAILAEDAFAFIPSWRCIARALDEITSMKILSRIEGDETRVSKTFLDDLGKAIKDGLETVFAEIFDEDDDDVYTSVSLAKLDEMKKRLDSGYTSFWS